MNQQRGTPTPATIRINLNTLLAQAQTQIANIEAYDGVIPDFDQEFDPQGQIFAALTQENLIPTYTNLSYDTLIDFFQSMQPFIVDAGVRGPKCKSSIMDQLLCYLIWGKLGTEYDKLGKQFSIKPNRMEKNIDRVRPIINKTLRFRWWSPHMRPEFQDDSPFPHVALLMDHHTSHTFRPKAPFLESKIYWDGHHKIYGLKNCFGIMASPPHYCQFIFPNDIGSVNDYKDLKDHYQTCMQYLLKTPEEAHHLQGDLHNRYWAACLDKAYIGPKEDTPDFRRIVPKKGRNLSLADYNYNRQVANFRVPIEQYFGRLMKLWAVPRNIYRWDHKHFQEDIENFSLLTNEHIKDNQLAGMDYDFYQKFLAVQIQRMEEQERKQKASQERAKEKKKRRLELIDPMC